MKQLDTDTRKAIMDYATDWLKGEGKEPDYTPAYKNAREHAREALPGMTDEEFAIAYRILRYSSGKCYRGGVPRSIATIEEYLAELKKILNGMEKADASATNPISVTDAAVKGGIYDAASEVNGTTRRMIHDIAKQGLLYELEIRTCGSVAIRLYGIK